MPTTSGRPALGGENSLRHVFGEKAKHFKRILIYLLLFSCQSIKPRTLGGVYSLYLLFKKNLVKLYLVRSLLK